ncbi:sugar phosphate isomerase/epimerase family protein [Paenibacillus koleovorans]|uniref:sugar phosphate isomerase/epimerase family protein n=1 Tax=Paenibacillus koleovorans TaxID=121608 RepID=UPI000FD84D35|nr:sugar phosphate isomerase/epimerase [Paenibacillus koleovorans]
MKLSIAKSTWGMTGTLLENTKQIIAGGYTGIETVIPREQDRAAFLDTVRGGGLDLMIQVFTEGPDHYASFRAQVEQAASLQPKLIVSHSLKDSSPLDEQRRFFEQALKLEREIGIPIAHETHRGRAFFTPWHTAQMLTEFPELNVTADFSHFCCVCESLLGDQEDNLKRIIARALHVHARVGYAEGPQVPHPAAPEYASELAAHEGWWEQIFAARAAAGHTVTTVTSEFGPPGYLHTLPFTNAPVANLWDVCLWMQGRLKERFPQHQ